MTEQLKAAAQLAMDDDDIENDPPAREASDWAPEAGYDGDGSVAAMERRAALATDAVPTEPSTSFVQPVPDHCDRIIWRNQYFHLPLKAAPQPAAEREPQPDECAAHGDGHRFGPHGINGEQQCEWCGRAAGGVLMSARALDPCCGSRMMWFDRSDPETVFGDRRREVITVTDNSRGNKSGQRIIEINPDSLMDFRALPFPDETFSLVAFDPPHLECAGPRSWLVAKYGKLGADWRDDLSAGFAECFRVLAENGTLVFKWNETQIKTSEVLACTPVLPKFGHTSGRKGLTHWIVFLKPRKVKS